MEITLATADDALRTYFAPWIQEMELKFETVEPGRVRVRIPNSPRLARIGGAICGQALMAVADTAMVFAVGASLGGFREMATVSQNTSFFRAASDSDVICEVRLLKLGRTLAFGEATMSMAGKSDPVAQATMTYAIAAPKPA